MSTDRGMDKNNVVFTHSHTHTHTHTHTRVHAWTGILLSRKKEWNNAICSNTDAPRDYYTKWNNSERGRLIAYDITCGI